MTQYPVPPRNRTGNRTGYTTGSNSAAAAKAATLALLTGQWPAQVDITLPIGETATMTPVEQDQGGGQCDGWAYCCMVKDAGDDPDVTHGALICARVELSDAPGFALEGGVGVGRVTLPGIGLPVGDPAINAVPREQIQGNVTDGVNEAGHHAESYLAENGLTVTISVPEGEKLAEKTLNARLGILGGISILGTTGKVFAYSTASWRASVIQAVEVAAFNNAAKVVMTTGGRSERFGMEIFPELSKVAFVQLSIFTGAGLETCVRHGVKSAVFIGMIGKMIKTAQGHMTTHVAGNQVDFEFLAAVCQDVNAPQALIDETLAANTGRHVLELCQEHDFMPPITRITELAYDECEAFIVEQGGQLELDVILVDFSGNILARKSGRTADTAAKTASDDSTLMERLAQDPANAYADDEDGRSITGE